MDRTVIVFSRHYLYHTKFREVSGDLVLDISTVLDAMRSDTTRQNRQLCVLSHALVKVHNINN